MPRLIVDNVWAELRKAGRATGRPSDVAVAYMAESGAKLLKLAPHSRLVVDASLAVVRAGLTHPATLAGFVKRGVRVYSYSNLHAKVFVIGGRAFVGSANASASSAQRLREAVLVTSEPRTVGAVRRFVRSLCIDELSPAYLEELQKQYRPPKGPNDATTIAKRKRMRSSSARLVQLELTDYPEDEEALARKGRTVAKSRREHSRSWEIQEFRLSGRHDIHVGDSVVQIIDEGGRSPMVEPAGKVIHVQRRRTARGRVAYVYLELRPASRRLSAKQLAKRLGSGGSKVLRTTGPVLKKYDAKLRAAYSAR